MLAGIVGGAVVAGLTLATLAYLGIQPGSPDLWWARYWPFAQALAGVVLAGIIAIPVSASIARRYTAPLQRLAAAAASFAAGNRTRRAPSGGPREIRMVAEAFNKMAEDVAEVMEELSSEERSKGRFVSDVSHELRTPLTAIRGAAETLLDGGVSPDDQVRFLSTIATEASRLTRLANDLLQLQRIEGATGELPFRRIDVKGVIERAVAMLEPLMEDRGVSIEISGAAPVVLGDTDRLQQVVANLVDNASRVVGEGGHIEIALSQDERHAVIEVIDDGPGIPDADIDRLFDRFFRSDASRSRSRGGTGLGLSIARAIVVSHGGSLSARNLAEGGTVFTVLLPRLAE